VITLSNELQHHGIKGQKWGVRRFQNTDGSLTAEGKKRYSVNDYQQAIDKTKTAGKIVNEAKTLNNTVKKLNDPAAERRIRKSAAEMSDIELQKRVQRLNMEDNYTRMMLHRESLERGRTFVDKALDVSAIAVQGTVASLTIALLVKQLTGK
jgi:hypothetical protein